MPCLNYQKMKRILLSLFFISLIIIGLSQIPPASSPTVVGVVCPNCGYIDFESGEHHKPGCPYDEQNSSSSQSVDPERQQQLEDRLCPECGGTNGHHNSDCMVGRAYKLLYEYRSNGKSESDIRRMEDNIILLKKANARPQPTAQPATTGRAQMVDMQPRPLFSGINERNLSIPPTAIGAYNDWGSVDVSTLTDPDFKYDIYHGANTAGTPRLLGAHLPNGTIQWKVFKMGDRGQYVEVENPYPVGLVSGGNAPITDLSYICEGQLIRITYDVNGTDAYAVYNTDGVRIFPHKTFPYPAVSNFLLLNYRHGGLDLFQIEVNGCLHLINSRGDIVSSGEKLTYYDNVIIETKEYEGDTWYVVRNYEGKGLICDEFGSELLPNTFSEAGVFNSPNGSYLVLKKRVASYNKKDYILSDQFFNVYGQYESADAAHAAWRNRRY